MNIDIIEIIGYVATVLLMFGYLPQTIQTIRTRKTDDIALGTFLLLGCGSFLFSIYGFLKPALPMGIANLATTIMNIIIFSIKLHNDIKKKKNK